MVDLSFDPKSDKYFVVSYADGIMLMFDIETQQVLQVFDKQNVVSEVII